MPMTLLPFAQRSQRAQITQLRPIALQVCQAFDVRVKTLTCINHGFNTTYAVVDQREQKYALRLNTHSLRDTPGLHAEVAWMQALATGGVVRVPQLCRTPQGQHVVEIAFPPLQKMLSATMTHWLPGRIVGARPSYQQLMALGRLTAQLHQQSVDWRPVKPATFPMLNRLLLNSDDHLAGLPASAMPAELYERLMQIRPRIDAVFDELNERSTTQPIHADLHPYNVMWHQGELTVFDFDDAGYGLAIQDIANTLYYVRDLAYADEAVLRGYEQVAPLPVGIAEHLESLLMARGIVLLNDLLVLTNPADVAFVPEFMRRITLRLRHFMDTGRFALCT
jgi:Ser/Thr protein kinase RdoA (MazF antagonist)